MSRLPLAPFAANQAALRAVAAVLAHVEGWSRDDAETVLLVALAAGARGVTL